MMGKIQAIMPTEFIDFVNCIKKKRERSSLKVKEGSNPNQLTDSRSISENRLVPINKVKQLQ